MLSKENPWTCASWIWPRQAMPGRNDHACFRRSFVLRKPVRSASLAITADSRYVAHLNGELLGRGPVRCFPTNQRYDLYDLTATLRPGSNCLAIIVRHFGESNFQYILGRGGLLAQLDVVYADGSRETIGTDERWRAAPHPGYAADAPRLSVQLDFEEHFNAAAGFCAWQDPVYDDGSWLPAMKIASAGDPPWVGFSPRDIPFLSEVPVPPARVHWSRLTRPPSLASAVDFAPTLLPGVKDSNMRCPSGLLVTVLRVPQPASVTFLPFWNSRPLRCAGKDIPLHDEPVTIDLPAGEHLLVADVSGRQHLTQFTLVLRAEPACRLELLNPLTLEPVDPWATVGPLSATPAEREALLQALLSPADLARLGELVRTVPWPYYTNTPVAALTTTQQPLPEAPVPVANLSALSSLGANEAVIGPTAQGDCEILLDFGQELVGHLAFTVTAPEGAVLDWNLFEAIEDGRIHYTAGLNNALRYRCRAGKQQYTALGRRGFRYALLTVRSPNGAVQLSNVRCLRSTYPMCQQGEFLCSDPALNEIWRLSRYTALLCSEDTFVDCPAYEQTFWVGDARNEALITYYVHGDYALARRCWLLAAESLQRSPLVESQVPSGWQNILPAWSLLWAIACQEYYLHTGDLAFLQEVYPALRMQAENALAMRNGQGLFFIRAWNMLDWAPMDTPEDGVVTHQNAWLVEALRRTASVAQVLGHDGEAGLFLRAADELRLAIDQHLWSEQEHAFVDCLHADGSPSPVISEQTNTVVYLCKAASEERLALLEARLLSCPPHWVRIGSPFMMFFHFEALASAGHFGRIVALTRERWGEMLAKGATTCWETFPGFDPKWWTRSHCHAWSAAPGYFLGALQLGARPMEPGFRRVRVAPQPAGLQWARGQVPTPHGPIAISWQLRPTEFSLQVQLPQSVAGELVLPPPVPGTARILCPTGHVPAWDGRRWLISAQAGALVQIEARW